MTRTIAVVTAGLSQPSSTRLLADQLAAATERALRLDAPQDVRVEVVELRDLAHQLVDNLLTGFPSGALADAVSLVREADAVIAVSPIFEASYSGLFKMFFDVLEQAPWRASRWWWPPPPARPGTRWRWSSRCARCSPTSAPT
jgi:FMN reductase